MTKKQIDIRKKLQPFLCLEFWKAWALNVKKVIDTSNEPGFGLFKKE